MDEKRVLRIEEAQLFAEKRSDDHDMALRELGERLIEMMRRFERLEQRFERLLEAAPQPESDGDEIPPHSARLPGGR